MMAVDIVSLMGMSITTMTDTTERLAHDNSRSRASGTQFTLTN